MDTCPDRSKARYCVVSVAEDPIRVYFTVGDWVVDYGSYAHGYHSTRDLAVAEATKAAEVEHRGLIIEDRGTEATPASRRRDKIADERDAVADERDRVADRRDDTAAERDRAADKRERLAVS